MGSSAVAALIAHVTFWLLLVYGWLWDEVRGMAAAVLVSLWIAGWLGLPYLPCGAELFSS